jgi:hypothetical protein
VIDINGLFVAVPQLTFNFNFVQQLREMGLLTNAGYEDIVRRRKLARRGNKVLDALSSGSLLERLMAVAPEIINTEMVDLLSGVTWEEHRIRVLGRGDNRRVVRKVELITASQAHALRLAIRSLGAGSRGGLPANRDQMFNRMGRLFGVFASTEHINFMLSMGLLTSEEATRYKGYLRSGKVIKETLTKARRAKSLLDALMVLGDIPVSREMVSGMIQSGIITERIGSVYLSLVDLGVKEWKVFEGVRGVEGYRRRLLMVLSGSFNANLLDFLVQTNVITNQQWSALQIGEVLSRRVNDRMLDDLTARRYRVRPGEPPIRTFARASRTTDQEILRLLASAAKEARKEAEVLAGMPGIGAKTRSRQFNLAAKGLHGSMRAMWENVGYLTIWGEREVAEAAAESASAMQSSLLKGRLKSLDDSLLRQSRAGVDAYISRQENTIALSRYVYKNMALYQGKVDERINLSLLQGKSPAELAADVARFISPSVPGGVSFSAMRLARTEINNAFHLNTIRNTRENPWVRGYKWNLSGSHGRPDECNRMSAEDHSGLGHGIYRKANVPGKPHPQCLCYITTVQMSETEFISAYRSGRFNSYIKQATKTQQ